MAWAKKKGNDDCVILHASHCTALCSVQAADRWQRAQASAAPAKLLLLCATCCPVHAAQLPLAQEESTRG